MALSSDKIGDYTIVRPLGKGGMGDVYLAQDPAIGRLVAIKLLKSGLDDPDARERFAREAQSAGRLRHPNIVTLFHVGEHDERPYIVMEYIPGETLAEVIRQQPPLTLTRKIRIIEDLCRGLGHAHRFGVVHRDIKPANVIVDSDGTVKILDFGIARVSDQSMTRYGVLIGTPNYMSPEQILNPGTADKRTDVFSVGLVLYELLSYQRAFPGEGYAVLNKVVTGEIEPIEAVFPDIQEELAVILRQAISKAPETRYQEVGPLRTDLSRLRLRLHSAAGTDETADEGPIGDSDVFDIPTATTMAPTHTRGHLTLAREAFEANDFERAIAECDLALEEEADNAEASALRHRAQHELDVTSAHQLFTTAQSAVTKGDLSSALDIVGKIEALRLSGETATPLLKQLTILRRTIASEQKTRRITGLLAQARQQFYQGDLNRALSTVNELAVDASNLAEFRALEREVRAAISAREASAAAEINAVPLGGWDVTAVGTPVPTPLTATQARESSPPRTPQPVPTPTATPTAHAPRPLIAAPNDVDTEAFDVGGRRRPAWIIPTAAAALLAVTGIAGWLLLNGDRPTESAVTIPGTELGRVAEVTTTAPVSSISVPATTTIPPVVDAPAPTSVPAPTTVPATTTVPTRQARQIPVTIPPVTVPEPVTQAQIPRDRPTSIPTTVAPTTVAPTTSVPATTPTTVPATTSVAVASGPNPTQDTAAIRAVLNQFLDGYRRLDVAAIRRVFPRSPADFKDVKAIEMELSDIRIALSGDRATVSARRFVRQTGTSGRPQEQTRPATFQMRRDGAGWIIEAIQ